MAPEFSTADIHQWTTSGPPLTAVVTVTDLLVAKNMLALRNVVRSQQQHRLVALSNIAAAAVTPNGAGVRSVHVEAKIKDLGLTLPPASAGWPTKGSFVQFYKVGNLVYVSGHLPQPAEGQLIVGKVGKEITVEQGYEAAKLCGLNLCATLKHNIEDLDKIKRIVKITGFVNCVDNFTQQPAVINGCSDLFLKIFGERGASTRSAVGTNALPLGVPVEIELIAELE